MKEIRGLTGLRGVAALIVFLDHTRGSLEARGLSLPVPTVVARLFLSGGREVDIFFVLSGFILALIYNRWFRDSLLPAAYLDFLRRRFARIYPLHVFMLLLTIAFVGSAYALHAQAMNGLDRFTVSTLPATFLMVHAWGFVGDWGGPWNPPSWSISIEALAYLAFPLFIRSTSGLGASRPWLLWILAAVFGFFMNFVTPWGLTGFPGIARGGSEFFFGCATANLFGSSFASWTQSPLGSVSSLLALGICFALLPDMGFIAAFATAPLLLTLCGNNRVSRFFGCAPIWFLGEISYSVYLGHFLYGTIANRLVRPEWMMTGQLHMVLGMVALGVIVIAFSTITYFAVERPCRDLLSGRRSKTLRAAAPLGSA
jgi:peptidoglycan/LPS O-acetylase OafA/YrhL